ncbi:MAG: hypothetical protein KJO21_03885 [Verrucomicrobiae bacterium]|nr:hypothetical protein [Verrucomicrobiae bacterium]NNJ42639.1 hypothetical protein [Akkermansiaceae bacterium]
MEKFHIQIKVMGRIFIVAVLFSIFSSAVFAQNNFSMGSAKGDVLKIMGKPDKVNRYEALGYESWKYGWSTVKISTRNDRVLEWQNKGNLKVSFAAGRNITQATRYTRGSHKDDVLRLQGTPDGINRYEALGYESWKYGWSTVKISTRNERVLEWQNKGNLKVSLTAGKNITQATYYTRGSHKDDVLRLQGTPENINRYKALGYESWKYGWSTVKISTRNDRVLEWQNQGNLKVRLAAGRNITQATRYTRGSHKDDVLRLQGTPGNINRYEALGYESWKYGWSTVKISTRNDRVLEWQNKGNLKVGFAAGRNITQAIQYTHGSHKDDVLRLQGTPDGINRYKALGYETWTYGNSRVKISILSAKVLDYADNGTLKVKPMKSLPKRLSKYHHKHRGMTLYYDENKTYTGVVSFDDKNLGKVYGMSERGVMYFYDKKFKPLNLCAYSNGKSIKVSSVRGAYDPSLYKYINSAISSINISGDITASGTTMRLGNMTFTDLVTDNGSYVHGTSIDFGNLKFDDYYSGNGVTTSGSRINIGNISFGDWSSSDGSSVSGSSQRLGNFIYHDYTGSDGKIYSGTTMEIGGFSYTDVYGW